MTICPHCLGDFHPLGLASHRAACRRRARGTMVYTDVRHQRTAERFRLIGVTTGADLGNTLTEKQRAVVCAYLGLDGLAPTSMPSLALAFKTTKQAVWYLLHTALKKLERRRYGTRRE